MADLREIHERLPVAFKEVEGLEAEAAEIPLDRYQGAVTLNPWLARDVINELESARRVVAAARSHLLLGRRDHDPVIRQAVLDYDNTTWSNEEWQDSYPGRSADEVHEHDHKNASVTADLGHALEDGLLRLGPDAPSQAAQQEVERVLGFEGDAYLDALNHDRGTGG